MESSELCHSIVPHEIVDVKIEVNPDDVVDDGAKIFEDDEEYRPGSEPDSESVPSEGDSEMEESAQQGLGEMEGNVINFLAENRTRKKAKCSPRSNTRFKCNKCTSVFRYQSTLDYHRKSECGTKVIKGTRLIDKGSGKISCNVCEKNFCSRTALMVHMRIHTGERPFQCSLCERSFFQKAHLNDHVANMHSAGYALCRLCNNTFRDKLELSKHMKTHKEEANSVFSCQECKATFSNRNQRNQHMTKVHGMAVSNVVRCGICSEPFDSLALLMKHRADAHPGQHRAAVPETGGAICQECGNKYTGLKQLQAHMRRYHRASLPCPHCPRMLPSKYDLRIHLRSHTGEKPYPCEFCGRSFSRKSVLELHITLHTGTKDFLCCVCGAGFNRKSKLIVHFAEHTNARFQCKICKKEYKCESYLKCHMKTHQGPSKCPCCNQPFLTRRSLVNHMKKYHEEWFYSDGQEVQVGQDTTNQDGELDPELSEEPEDSKEGILCATETARGNSEGDEDIIDTAQNENAESTVNQGSFTGGDLDQSGSGSGLTETNMDASAPMAIEGNCTKVIDSIQTKNQLETGFNLPTEQQLDKSSCGLVIPKKEVEDTGFCTDTPDKCGEENVPNSISANLMGESVKKTFVPHSVFGFSQTGLHGEGNISNLVPMQSIGQTGYVTIRENRTSAKQRIGNEHSISVKGKSCFVTDPVRNQVDVVTRVGFAHTQSPGFYPSHAQSNVTSLASYKTVFPPMKNQRGASFTSGRGRNKSFLASRGQHSAVFGLQRKNLGNLDAAGSNHALLAGHQNHHWGRNMHPGFAGSMSRHELSTFIPEVQMSFPEDDQSVMTIPKPEINEDVGADDDDDGEFYSLPPQGGEPTILSGHNLPPNEVISGVPRMANVWHGRELTISRCPQTSFSVVPVRKPINPAMFQKSVRFPLPGRRRAPPTIVPLPADVSINEMVQSLPPGVGFMPPPHAVFLDEPVDYRLSPDGQT